MVTQIRITTVTDAASSTLIHNSLAAIAKMSTSEKRPKASLNKSSIHATTFTDAASPTHSQLARSYRKNVDELKTPEIATVSTTTTSLSFTTHTQRALLLVFIRVVVVEALALRHEGPLQDHLALFISLVLLGRVLIHPAELRLAVLTRHIPHHVTSGQHHAVLHVAEVQVDDAVEQKRSARRAREPGRDQLVTVRKRDVAARAREQTRTAEVVQEDTPHPAAAHSSGDLVNRRNVGLFSVSFADLCLFDIMSINHIIHVHICIGSDKWKQHSQ